MIEQKSTKLHFFGISDKKQDDAEYQSVLCPQLLGSKGAGLCTMSSIGIPVPPGFIIDTRECAVFTRDNTNLSKAFTEEVKNGVQKIEKYLNKNFRGGTDPLLLSVRSGATVSMPGMMDTILNIGLNDSIVINLAEKFSNEIFALDSYRRFIQMYSSTVLKVPSYKFEAALSDIKMTFNITQDSELTSVQLKRFIDIAKKIALDISGKTIPEDPYEQLFEAIKAVFNSWQNERAKAYRKIHNISEDYGTAINIQSMVFGNLNKNSATGVIFTRNPSTGEKVIYGEYLQKAQGEDVVSGIRTPKIICATAAENDDSLERTMPEVFSQLSLILETLEMHYKDMQDVEFTIQDGTIWILQTRSGKRHIKAAIKIAYDMVQEGLISKEDAVMRIDAKEIPKLLHSTPIWGANIEIVATGLAASPGVGTGAVVFNAIDAEIKFRSGIKTVLVREETSPEDIRGMHVAQAVLTARGGMTSHAAVVARGMGVCCVVGCESIRIVESNRTIITTNGIVIKEGDIITVDGSSGKVVLGDVPMEIQELNEELITILNWADEFSTISVRANADTAEDCRKAIKFGAKGVGLCRTEHMFFEESRLTLFRKAILSDHSETEEALNELSKMQREDFEKMFITLNGLPINIRLLDPPLHEFLPKTSVEIADFCTKSGLKEQLITSKIMRMKEHNPMLGYRGCRLGISFPALYQAQTRAIFLGYIDAKKKGINVDLEIMFPLVISKQEVVLLKKMVSDVKDSVEQSHGCTIIAKIGTMIELPGACIAAGNIAKEVEYFSFGTNDLTQTTLGISRDDYEMFLQSYKDNSIFEKDPFVTIDTERVVHMIEMACNNGKQTNPNLTFSVCGEHGGDPESISFLYKLDMKYVSCSPYRIPVARLATAKATIANKNKSS